MKKESVPKSKTNKKKSGLKWEYHEKFKLKYETYLLQNANKNNIRLKGNYHYENKPINFYLNQKEIEPIKNTNLTPLPQSKYLNQKMKEKNMEEYIEFSNIQKNVVQMRRFEYNIKLVKKKDKEKQKIDNFNKLIKSKDENKNDKNTRKMQKRNSCIQLNRSVFLLNKKRKTMNMIDLKDFILNNINNLNESEMPKEVLHLLKIFKSKVIIIQRKYKKHLNNLKKIIKIQANYKSHLYSKLYKEFHIRKEKIKKLIYIIQKVLFLNLYHLKVNPKPKFASTKSIITKYEYAISNIYKIIHLQREIKYYLFCKKLKLLKAKKKCVYNKPYTICPLAKIKLIQRNIIIFLERLKRRHKIQTSQIIYKRKDHTKKIILIQKLARALHRDVVYPPIPKERFSQNNVFMKSNRKYGRKKSYFINTNVIPFIGNDINKKVKIRNSLRTKSHKYLEKIIFLQRYIKTYLSREDYDKYDYPKEEEYITKQSYVLPKKDNLLYIQSEVKYFLYRQKIRVNTIKKIVIEPLKCTKTIRTNTEKIFTRLSKLRILYDKDLIILIVKIIEVIRRYLGRTCFKTIKEFSSKRNRFIGNDGKLSFIKLFAQSSLMKQYIVKVVEPEYSIEKELKKQNKNINKKNKEINSQNKENENKKEIIAENKEEVDNFEEEEEKENKSFKDKNKNKKNDKENKPNEKKNIINPFKKLLLNLK